MKGPLLSASHTGHWDYWGIVLGIIGVYLHIHLQGDVQGNCEI